MSFSCTLNISRHSIPYDVCAVTDPEVKFEILKSLSKFNAHLHLGGEIPLKTLKKYATPEQMIVLEKIMSEMIAGKDYEQAFSIFPLISKIIDTHEKLEEGTFRACRRLQKDNNRIVLMRTGLKILEGKEYEEYLKTVLAGIRKASCEDFHVFLMLSVKRSSSPETVRQTIDLALQYREYGVAGIDISDVSTVGDIKLILEELKRAKQNGLKIAVHMGEAVGEEDQMLILDELEPDMIDHGVHLCPEAVNWIKNHKTPVTVCPTSSIATKMHSPEDPHPRIADYKINPSEYETHAGTDDSTVFNGITLTDELFGLHPDLGFGKVVQLVNESFRRAEELFGNEIARNQRDKAK